MPLTNKERMAITRQPMPERNPNVRNRDFNEVNLGLTLEMAQAEARRCLDCANPLCITGCPVAIDITEEVRAIRESESAKKGAP